MYNLLCLSKLSNQNIVKNNNIFCIFEHRQLNAIKHSVVFFWIISWQNKHHDIWHPKKVENIQVDLKIILHML